MSKTSNKQRLAVLERWIEDKKKKGVIKTKRKPKPLY